MKNCEKITYYIEKGHLTELNLSEKLQIKLHQLICSKCKKYETDSEFLNNFMTKLDEADNKSVAFELSIQDKDKLKEVLEGLD